MKLKTVRCLNSILATILAGTMLMATTGCNSTQNNGEIAVIVKSQGSAYWDVLKMGVDDAASETGYSIYYAAPPTEADIADQEQLVLDAIQKQVKAIVIAPIDADSLNDELKQASDANIPVVCVDSDCTFEDKQSFISSNNFNAGAIEGRHAGDLLVAKGGGKVAIVGHTKGAGNANGRIGGFIDTLVGTYGASVENLSQDQYISGSDISYSQALDIGEKVRKENNLPEIEIVGLEYCDAKQEIAQENTRKFLSDYPDLSLIFATNQQTTLGTIDVMNERGGSNGLIVLGFDSGEVQEASVNNGTLYGFIAQSPYNMGYLGIRYAHKLINNEKIPSLVDTGVTFVDQSNITEEGVDLIIHPKSSSGATQGSAEDADAAGADETDTTEAAENK